MIAAMSDSKTRRIFVSSALPYANGSIHLGHMVEVTQCDIWVRYQRLVGHDCYYVCADDTHGTATMLRAEAEGTTPEALIAAVEEEHVRDFARFAVHFDNFTGTNAPENRELTETFYKRLDAAGTIAKRSVEQLYDPEREMFLPDRYVRGGCPVCKTPDQYGDSCDHCGSTYSPTELIDPRSVVSGETPVLRRSEHYFVELSKYEDMLREWVSLDRLQVEVVNKLQEWFDAGLRDWDISRDAPYFGFEIPGAPGKYFYVWVDAPIGYLASFRQLCEREGLDFDAFWDPERAKEEETEVFHFIGKDILYFHCLFWPAMLRGAGFRLPDAVFVHGFLTVDGKKMSKSRGTFINAATWAKHLEPDTFRYYIAAKLGPNLADIDLNLEDFQNRVNSDLVGKFVNIASRCAGFLEKRFDGRLGATLDQPELLERLSLAGEEIGAAIEGLDYNRAVRRIMAVADEANRYIDERKPWEIARQDDRQEELHAVCTTGIHLFKMLATWLGPIVPATVERAEAFLATGPLLWKDAGTLLGEHQLNTFKPLLTRVQPEDIQAMIEESKTEALDDKAKEETVPATGPLADDPIAAEVEFPDFAKVDLRVVRIVRAQHVEGADKLLQLTLDLGGEERNVFAGIKSAYEPQGLEGRLTVMVANLAPRKMRFGVSEGMVLAAGPGGSDIFLLEPDSGAVPGMRVS